MKQFPYGKKGKAVPLQAWRGPEGTRKLRFPDYVTTAQDGGRLSAICTGRLYPQEILLVLILLEAESTPGPKCDQKDFMSMKNPLTPAGIEPVNFLFVAQLGHVVVQLVEALHYNPEGQGFDFQWCH